MIRLSYPLLFALALSGCASMGGGNSNEDPYYAAQGKSQTQQLHADLVREMISQGRYYAALAHIEDMEKSQGVGDELRLLKAQVLSKLDRQPEAEQIYTTLLHGPYEGEARHGLGLMYAAKNYPLSLQNLQLAAALNPTSAVIRNDYGYALLIGGRYPEARLQLATAYELDAANGKNRNNYVLSLLLQKDDASVKRMESSGAISAKTLDELRQKARGWPQVVRHTLAQDQPMASPTMSGTTSTQDAARTVVTVEPAKAKTDAASIRAATPDSRRQAALRAARKPAAGKPNQSKQAQGTAAAQPATVLSSGQDKPASAKTD